MDVNYFLDQAENSYQHEFNEDWADVITELTDDQTILITEDGYTMTIDWTTEGEFEGYFLIIKTIKVMENLIGKKVSAIADCGTYRGKRVEGILSFYQASGQYLVKTGTHTVSVRQQTVKQIN